MLLTSMLLLGGVCLVDLQATESESMDYLYHGPGRGGLCKYIIAARIMAHFGGDLAKAKAFAMLSLGEACRYLEFLNRFGQVP